MPWPDDLVNYNANTVVDPKWALPGVLEAQAKTRLLDRRDALLPGGRSQQDSALLDRRDALLNPPPVDIAIAKLDEQMAALDKDIQMRMQTKARLEAQKNALVQKARPKPDAAQKR